jgi:glycosyltransferase involved in cell wall biosynthesis
MPKLKTTASGDGVIRIVSCAFLVDVKRIDLIVRGIAELANRMSALEIEWTHFGDGPLMPEILLLTQSILPKRVKCNLIGHVSTDVIYQWYFNQPVDVFINVSKSEGTPVSIMEAISCSIPVIATSVGGNREIVNDSLGILIPEDPTPEDISSAIVKVCLDLNSNLILRSGASEMWQKNYNADINYSDFRETFLSVGVGHLNPIDL